MAGAKEVRAGGAYVEVSTKDNTASGLASISRKLASWGTSITRIDGAAVSAASGAAVASVFRAVNRGSEVKDMADRTGLSTDAVQELGYAAAQTATDLGELEGGIKLMQKNVSAGGKELEEVFGKIGLNVDEMRRLNPDQQFMKIAEAMSQIPNQGQRVEFAMKIFGRSGAALVPLLSEGAAGIERMRARARELGLVMSNEAVVAAEEMGDRIAEARAQFDAVSVKIGVALLPALTSLLDILDDATPAINEFARAIAEISTGRDQILPGSQKVLGEAIRDFGKFTSPLAFLFGDKVTQFGKDMVQGAEQTAEFARRDLETKRRMTEENKIRAAQKRLQSEVPQLQTKPFGSFDARDFSSGVFKDEQKKQTDLLGDINNGIAALNRKDFGERAT